MRPSLLLVSLSILSAGVGCGTTDVRLATAAATPIRPEWGALLDGDERLKVLDTCSRARPSGLSEQWTPHPSDIDRLERRLSDVLGAALAHVVLEGREVRPEPADYYRQYAAFRRAGRPVIYVNGVHRAVVERSAATTWTRKALGLCDGGLLGFGVVYDVEADSFGPVEFDGWYSGPIRTQPR